MMYFIKRFTNLIGITVISSFSVFLILLTGFIPNTRLTYFFVFGISAAIFLVLNINGLRKSLFQTKKLLKYFLVNGILWAVLAATSFVCKAFLPGTVYTAFFGFTKMFNSFGVSVQASAIIFWVIYLFEIIYFPVERARALRRETM